MAKHIKQIISFLGLPGAGKGTQATFVSKEFGLPSYSLGQMLRDTKDDSVKKVIDKGLIVADEVVNKIVTEVLYSVDKGCLLDGYPRNISQARFLHENQFVKVLPIYLELDEDVLLERITSRIQCKKCDKVYKDTTLKNNVFSCILCGSSDYYRRSDDNSKVVAVRIEQFKENTIPVLDFYRSFNLLYVLNAGLPIEVLSMHVKDLIEKFIT